MNDNNPRKIIRLDEGGWIEAQLTEEGVIVDEYDRDGEILSTFGQTYDELLGANPQKEGRA